MASRFYSITLAAGSSSRMPVELRPKACCRVGASSVIDRALTAYEQAGIEKHIIVVGAQADRVMAEVTSSRPDVLFAFQPSPKGTGHAVRCALDLLRGVDVPEHVLISAGDKIIAPQTIRGLLETYTLSEADLALAVGTSPEQDLGRVIFREGKPIGIVEKADIRVRQLARHLLSVAPPQRPGTVSELTDTVSAFVNPGKVGKLLPALGEILSGPPHLPVSWQTIESVARAAPEAFHLAGHNISLEEAAAAELANLSVYVVRFDTLIGLIDRLQSNNAQGEWYLTDVLEILVRQGGKVEAFRTRAPEDILGFNTLAELERVRTICATQPTRERTYPTVTEWRNFFAAREERVLLECINGLAARTGDDRQCIVVRSPGRINLMGRHIDHQGGTCNLLAIDREIVMAVSPREDDRVNLWNSADSAYPYRTFTFSELVADIVWEDWLRTLGSQYVQRTISQSAGDWGNYVKGAALRLQHRFKDRRLRGMDMYVSGSIPAGAGLSSSSALVVATAEALTELNSLNVGISEFVDLCGEGEWFVGTRGGSADHAAIKYGKENQVVAVSFFPFRILGSHPFPSHCRLLVCYSGVAAKKTEGARARFNAPVACYHITRELVKERFPQFAARIEHLRDINEKNLDLTLPGIYALLREIPDRITAQEVSRLAERHTTVAKFVAGLDIAAHEFRARDVAFYGLAECARAERAGELLDIGDVEALGEMMSLSHDGDRVTQWKPVQRTFDWAADEERVTRLIEHAGALRPLSQSRAALWQQPGAYGCSIPEIDFMVDSVLASSGVYGAQLAGAGLGGCIMVLVHKDAAESVRNDLIRQYYEPRGIAPSVFICQPAGGSQALTAVAG